MSRGIPGPPPHTGTIADDPSGYARSGDGPTAPPTIDRDLAALIEEHSEAVFRVANGILRNPSLAEDALQETLIRAWQSLPKFRGDSSVRSWILSIAHNTSISMLRRRREALVDPSKLPDRAGGVDPARTSAARADLAVAKAALDGLDDLSRSVVVLREVEGMTYEQIATTLSVPVPTVKTRLMRARRALQSALRRSEE